MKQMGFLKHAVVSFISNIAALIASAYFVSEFHVDSSVKGFLTVALLLTAINLVLRPILKLILTPLIALTLGLFSLVLNAALLYGLDFYSDSLTINGLPALVYATIIITLINVILHFAARRALKRV